MIVQPEPWLMLLALLLYLFDATRLLNRDEALVALGPHGWRARFGMREWTIAAREPLLPNPLTGFRPAYQVRWLLFAADGSTSSARQLDEGLPFTALGVAVKISTVCLFVLLPLGLFTRAGSVLTIFTAILITLNNVVALLMLYRRRKLFKIEFRHFLTLATECLLCPPFSLNLVRKVCAFQEIDEDLESIARRLFNSEDIRSMRDACLARIDDALLSLPEEAAEEDALRQTRMRLEAKEFAHEH